MTRDLWPSFSRSCQAKIAIRGESTLMKRSFLGFRWLGTWKQVKLCDLHGFQWGHGHSEVKWGQWPLVTSGDLFCFLGLSRVVLRADFEFDIHLAQIWIQMRSPSVRGQARSLTSDDLIWPLTFDQKKGQWMPATYQNVFYGAR